VGCQKYRSRSGGGGRPLRGVIVGFALEKEGGGVVVCLLSGGKCEFTTWGGGTYLQRYRRSGEDEKMFRVNQWDPRIKQGKRGFQIVQGGDSKGEGFFGGLTAWVVFS